MKKLLSVLLILLSLSTFADSTAFGIHTEKHFKPLNASLLSAHHSVLAKQLSFDRDYTEDEWDKCRRYKRMQVMGFVFIGVGAGTLTGGIALSVIGFSNLTSNTNGGTFPGIGMAIGGVFLSLAGAAMLAAGIPISIIGSVKRHKYCGAGSKYREEHSFYISLSRNGTGIACMF